MRDDTAKVIVEPPRVRPFSSREGRRRDLDDLPTREGFRRAAALRGDRRQSNENLAPLRRYLERQVGRPWNRVYSEIASHLRVDSACGASSGGGEAGAPTARGCGGLRGQASLRSLTDWRDGSTTPRDGAHRFSAGGQAGLIARGGAVPEPGRAPRGRPNRRRRSRPGANPGAPGRRVGAAAIRGR